jgi:hypothetical protein
VVSYWKQAVIVSDNRIPALQGDTSRYRFALPETHNLVTVTAELRFRRAFQPVLDARSWDKPDIVMEERVVTIRPAARRDLYLPLLLRCGEEGQSR